MEDELISFKTAKLAKEKGFNWNVTHHYRDGGHYSKELIHGGSLYNMNSKEEQELWSTNLYSAPSQSLLQKWLREEHEIHVNISPLHLSDFDWRQQSYLMKKGHYKGSRPAGFHYKSYEKALEAGLLEALKLI